METITRWRWRYHIPGGRWLRSPLAMTDEEAERSAASYAALGVKIMMEKVPGTEQQDAPPGEPLPLRPSGGPSAPGFPKE